MAVEALHPLTASAAPACCVRTRVSNAGGVSESETNAAIDVVTIATNTTGITIR